MKIALEYEGNIVTKCGRDHIRYRDIPLANKNDIERTCGDSKPYDNNDYLAEFRLNPINIIDGNSQETEKLVSAFENKLIDYKIAFLQNGYEILWRELQSTLYAKNNLFEDKEKMLPKKTFILRKQTDNTYKTEPIKICGSEYRGGGIHFNISGIYITIPLLLDIQKVFNKHMNNKFNSKYRKGLLFRMTSYGFEIINYGFECYHSPFKRISINTEELRCVVQAIIDSLIIHKKIQIKKDYNIYI